MPLVSAQILMKEAQRGRYALPLFDFFQLTGIEGFFAAVKAKRAPAIFGMYQQQFESPMAPAMIAAVKACAANTDTPVSLYLDHGVSVEQARRALACGFTDVMIDASSKSLDENILLSRQVAEAAHAVHAGCEAELGHVGGGKDYQAFGAQRKGFTNPEDVERFVRETGVDCLAVAIGTAHGPYHGQPQLDTDLLDQIAQRTHLPLVLHGGTDLSEEQFRTAIAHGICKINIATDLVRSAFARLRDAISQPNANFFSTMKSVPDVMYEKCCYYLDLFGASGKA